jgi:DNA-binding SARP family transcriptional activator
MDIPGTTLEILTLGRFSISINGKFVAKDWPDESTKVFFCSLLSPLDLYFSWDRICRSIWDEPATRSSRHRLEEIVIRPLNGFLIRELGFNPLVAGQDGIRIDPHGVHVDAHEFHRAVVEGLALLTSGSHSAALEKLGRADSLYVGNYLPGMSGKIIENARTDIESLYRTAVLDGIWQARSNLYARTAQQVPERIRRIS